jgi:Mor family transcriptional regulator
MITAEYTKKGDGPIKPKDRRNPIGAFDALPEGVVRMIQKHFHGGTLYVPVDDRIKARRDERVMQMADSGVHYKDIADTLGITMTTIYTIIKKETVA